MYCVSAQLESLSLALLYSCFALCPVCPSSSDIRRALRAFGALCDTDDFLLLVVSKSNSIIIITIHSQSTTNIIAEHTKRINHPDRTSHRQHDRWSQHRPLSCLEIGTMLCISCDECIYAIVIRHRSSAQSLAKYCVCVRCAATSAELV